MTQFYHCKTLLIGDPNVGKSCVLSRFLDDSFSKEIIPPRNRRKYGEKRLNFKSKKLNLQIWNTPKTDEVWGLEDTFYYNAVGALLVYDIIRRESFKNLKKLLDQARKKSHPEISIILVGNKSDMENERVVTYDEGEKFAEENGLRFFETSCQNGENVNEAFWKMAEIMSEKIDSGLILKKETLQETLEKERQASEKKKKARCNIF